MVSHTQRCLSVPGPVEPKVIKAMENEWVDFLKPQKPLNVGRDPEKDVLGATLSSGRPVASHILSSTRRP